MKILKSLVGWYLILPSSGPAQITYYVTRHDPDRIEGTYGTDFHQREGAETIRKETLLAVQEEGIVTKGPGHLYYYLTISGDEYQLEPMYED